MREKLHHMKMKMFENLSCISIALPLVGQHFIQSSSSYGMTVKTFSSRICVAMEYMASIQVPLENVSLGVLRIN